MKITNLKTNRITTPLGYELGTPTISFVVTDTLAAKQKNVQVRVSKKEDLSELLYDSGKQETLSSLGIKLPIKLEPSTRYYWNVSVEADNGESADSEITWFETAKEKEWRGQFISPDFEKDVQAVIGKKLQITKAVKQARIYVLGLGVYELYSNGEKVGDEYLMPGLHDYDSWLQYQTYDLPVEQGDNNIEIMLGNGWYKGVFGLTKKEENFGDTLSCIADIKIWYEDGTTESIGTDLTWYARKSKVIETGIYPGEYYDATFDDSKEYAVKASVLTTEKLSPRLSPKLTVMNKLKPIEVIHTNVGETVLDMGQNMVGWLAFQCREPKGTKLHLQFGEILQDGNFYRDNLRSAKAEFTYIADGTDCLVRPHFTFYGFRYVKLEGFTQEIKAEDFEGWVLHSYMDRIGQIETSDPLVNQLFHNALWGQKGNFLDVPTDCPQRDERMGWTGDAQIFSGTACYNMDTYAFYTKFGHDVYCEQKKLNGSVPDVVPLVNFKGDASTAWGEAATVIPWNVYLHYGDKGILERQYDSMKAWVEYMHREDQKYGDKKLWQSGFHYGDWLALDGKVKGGVYGATDPFLIASAYYYYSTNIVAKAANILGKEEDAAFYQKLASDIKEAYGKEYFTSTGRLSVDTMTGYVVSLFMGLTPDFAYERTVKGLFNKIKLNGYHLSTGFVGTPYLCRTLSDTNLNSIAYDLLMEKGFPGWLYEVLMGATTIWERWNSVLPDGKISGTEMNSLNHYAYGSIVEWMYRNMIGIQPVEEAPGFKKALLAPMPSYQIQSAKADLDTASGHYHCGWELLDQTHITVKVQIPFDASAKLVLPNTKKEDVKAITVYGVDISMDQLVQTGENVTIELTAGEYEFTFVSSIEYRKVYSKDSLIEELMEKKETREIIKREFLIGIGDYIPFEKESYVLDEWLNAPFANVPYEKQEKIDKILREIK